MSNTFTDAKATAARISGEKEGQAEAWAKIGDDPIKAAHDAGKRAGKSAVSKAFRELIGFTAKHKATLENEARAELTRRVNARAEAVSNGDVKLDA